MVGERGRTERRRFPRRCRGSSPRGSTRSRGGEGAAPGRRGGRQGLLVGRARGDRRVASAASGRGAPARARAQRVRPPRAAQLGRRRDRVRVPPPARPRRRLRRRSRGPTAPSASRAAEWIEALGRPDDHAELARPPLPARARARARRRRSTRVARGLGRGALRRAGDRAVGAERLRERGALLRGGARARPSTRARPAGPLPPTAPRSTGRPTSAGSRCSRRPRRPDRRRRSATRRRRGVRSSPRRGGIGGERGRAGAPRSGARARRDPRFALGGARCSPMRRAPMLAGDPVEARRLGAEALTIAEQLGLEDLVPQRPDDDRLARAHIGDPAGSPTSSARSSSRWPRTIRMRHGPTTTSPRSSLGTGTRARPGTLARRASRRGPTRERHRRVASSWAQLFFADFDNLEFGTSRLQPPRPSSPSAKRGSPHYNEGSAHGFRARILLSRDDVEGALASAARGLELVKRGE